MMDKQDGALLAMIEQNGAALQSIKRIPATPARGAARERLC